MSEPKNDALNEAVGEQEQLAQDVADQAVEEAAEALVEPAAETEADGAESAADEGSETTDAVTEEATEAEDSADAALADAEEAAEALDSQADGEADCNESETAEQPAFTAVPAPAEEPASKKAKGIGDLVAVGILSIILGVLLCLPTFLNPSSGEGDSDLSGGVAATVNGTAIGENDVTAYIESFRASQGLTDEESWGKWMVEYGYTPEALRSDTIGFFTQRALIQQAVKENGIEVSDEQVEEQVSQIAEQLGGQEAFEKALSESGTDPQAYRESILLTLQQQELAKKVVQTTESIDDAQVLELLKMYYPDDVDADAKTLDGVDEAKVSEIRSYLESAAIEQGFNEWMNDYAEKAEVVNNDMPEGLPYAIDLAPYQDADQADEGASGEAVPTVEPDKADDAASVDNASASASSEAAAE